MSRGRSRFTSYADRVIDRFRNWPLTLCRADCPPGRALSLSGLQVVHLHQEDLAEVLLTPPIVGRLTAALTASGRVDLPPDPGWVQVHLDTETDLLLLESLVSLAIQANDPARHPVRHTFSTCPYAAPRGRARATSGAGRCR